MSKEEIMNDMNKNYKKMNLADESGFTLMELIVVIGIIIILIALLVPRFSGMTDKANAAAAQNDARIGLTALSAYVTGVDTQVSGKVDAKTATDEINRALGGATTGSTVNPVKNITVAADSDGAAQIQEKRGNLTYTVKIDARQGKITETDCSGDQSRCNALSEAGLLINGKYSATAPTVTVPSTTTPPATH